MSEQERATNNGDKKFFCAFYAENMGEDSLLMLLEGGLYCSRNFKGLSGCLYQIGVPVMLEGEEPYMWECGIGKQLLASDVSKRVPLANLRREDEELEEIAREYERSFREHVRVSEVFEEAAETAGA